MRKLYALCLFAALAAAGGCRKEPASDPNIADRFDPLFAQELQKRGYVADATRITVREVENISKLDLYGGSNSGELVSLQGIEYFASLVELDCSFHRLTSLDVSRNPALKTLSCGYNRLSVLDVSHNPALSELACSGNELASLDLSRNASLDALFCEHNRLASLDISANTALTELSCNANMLTSLNVSRNTALTVLYCFSNRLAALDVSHNPALTELYCSDNLLTSLDISQNRELFYFDCTTNPGDGSVFLVTAWFDNGSVPEGKIPSGPGYYDFPTGSWPYYDRGSVTVDYRQAE
ncbi:MAG: hypothetical protein K2L09_00790 [Alistipes sp.]|nr:hypothetical protein [Alistipes sp.]